MFDKNKVYEHYEHFFALSDFSEQKTHGITNHNRMHYQKGDLISVSGTLQVNQWTGHDGQTQSGYGLVADSVISAKTVRPGGNKRSGNALQQGNQNTPSPGNELDHAP